MESVPFAYMPVPVGYGCEELGFGPSLPGLFCRSLQSVLREFNTASTWLMHR